MSDASGTQRLYYDDAALRRFSATIVALGDSGRRVYLDRSAFYPTSGGQPHDTGLLADIAVVDVVDEDERVAHCLAEPIGLPVGAMVVGQVDSARRQDFMQQHTAQHLLSALLSDRYGWPTVSVHFGDVTSTVDVSGVEGLSSAQLTRIEREVNEAIVANHPVTVSYEDAATVSGLRKASDRDGVLRIVSIEGLDRSACGGTHVSRTGELGMLLLRGAEKTRGHTRIEYVCGERAVNRARADAELLARTARPLSAAPEDLPVLVPRQLERLAEQDAEIRRLRKTLAQYEAQALWQQTAPDASGIRRLRHEVDGPVKDAEALAQACVALGHGVILVTSRTTGGVLLATAADSAVDAGASLKAALQAVGGRGGGSPRLAQGSVPDSARLPELLSALGF
jgi:alanyl-tRNA synthetase